MPRRITRALLVTTALTLFLAAMCYLPGAAK